MADDSPVKWAKGQYTYRTIDEHRFRGAEDWVFHKHADGSRTITATVNNEDAGVLFHMVQRVDASFRPIESYVSHWVKGESRGTSHVVVSKDSLKATVTGPNGTEVQDLTIGKFFSVQPHPVSVDGWRGAFYDSDLGGVQQSMNFNISVAPNSETPLLGAMEEETIEFLGKETITVPAGTFDTEHYKFRGRADMWLTPKDRIVIRYAYFDQGREYVLTEYESGP